MSAVRTRILLGDDPELLARARTGIVSSPDVDLVMAATTQEAADAANATPRPRVAILPAEGEIDGVDVCRALKAGGGSDVIVILALPQTSARRDACFAAGADDVVFGQVEAAEIGVRIDARIGSAFRNAPTAKIELVVQLQGSATGPILECRGTQISREALEVTLPAGIQTPPVGTLVRAIFTLFEGGTLTVWGRFAAPIAMPAAPADAPAPAAPATPPLARSVVRLVGLTELERKSIDYFVDFFRKSATARAAVEEVTNDKLQETVRMPARSMSGGIVEDLRPTDETIRQIVDADPEGLAGAAARVASGRDAVPPPGFSVLRFKALVQKLSMAEMTALRGTTMHTEILPDLRLCTGAKLRLMEMNAQLRASADDPNVNKLVGEQAALAIIAEAQQIHKRLEAALQERLKSGNTEAMKDLGPVNVGLIAACLDLRKILEQDFLKKPGLPVSSIGAVSPAAQPAELIAQTKYEKTERPDDSTPRRSAASTGTAKSGKGRYVLGALLGAAAVVALWQNFRMLNPGPAPEFTAEQFLWKEGSIHVVQEAMRDNIAFFIVDGTWTPATKAERDAALAKMSAIAAQRRAADAKVITPAGDELASAPAAGAGLAVPLATPTP